MIMRRHVFIAAAVALAMACSGAKSKKSDPMEPDFIKVDVTVDGLSEDDKAPLELEIAKIDGVFNIQQDPLGNGTVYSFDYEGDLRRLQNRIEAIEYPGLRRQRVVATFQYLGFDNRSPVLVLISPKTEDIITDTQVEFVVEVKDNDVSEVTVNGQAAKEKKPGFYHAEMELPEGEQEVVLYAKDEAENETTEKVKVNVDTTPPEIDATVKVVVEGKTEPGSEVYAAGTKAEIKRSGEWRVELKVKQGQKTVEVVAIDEAGNKTTENKPIGL
jgi:hypothetical protein